MKPCICDCICVNRLNLNELSEETLSCSEGLQSTVQYDYSAFTPWMFDMVVFSSLLSLMQPIDILCNQRTSLCTICTVGESLIYSLYLSQFHLFLHLCFSHHYSSCNLQISGKILDC